MKVKKLCKNLLSNENLIVVSKSEEVEDKDEDVILFDECDPEYAVEYYGDEKIHQIIATDEGIMLVLKSSEISLTEEDIDLARYEL